ncbi:hypothetical protein CFC21_079537 [Triticum aestivum]|uniref:X8 domain-containing protein n=2 Tax=Triticum aestivum TaxID=4565 RepID=A0A9R1I008_WHEAT|nr:glucan endo-1,3-beta-glucosidase 1-like [Triticum aestivum]KAF7074706.1 hypothetical protein CFC21_079537 [Triticum aestivum]
MHTYLPPSAARVKNCYLKKQAVTRLILLLYFILHFATVSAQQEDRNWEKQWCIADEQTPDDILQIALSWACGPGGADCTMIEPNKSCYLPNTVRDHASYAFNSYWQKYKKHGGSCYFNAAAMVTNLNPSRKSCNFEVVP